MSDRRYRLVIVFLIVLAHLAAFLQFSLAAEGLAIPRAWRVQVIFLLGLSLAVSTAIPFVRRAGVVWALLATVAAALAIAGLPMGSDLTVESCLLAGLVLTASTFAARWPSTVFSAAVLALELLLQMPLDIAGSRVAPPSSTALASLGLSGAFVIVLCHLVSLFREQNRKSERVRDTLDESTLQLAQTNMALQEHAVLAVERAAESERRRLAREVHDVLAYTLTSLIMMMEAAIDLAGQHDSQLRQHLERIRDQTKEGVLEVRRTLQAIRRFEQTPETGLKAIFRLVQLFDRATHFRIRLHLGDAPMSFGAEKDRVAYRVVQEGISNALRHGRATEIGIQFSRQGSGVAVAIVDNGTGFDVPSEGFGLTGIRERISQVGGTVEIRGEPGAGTRLSVWIPLDAEGGGGAADHG
jgi:signal transduction histidine kinase